METNLRFKKWLNIETSWLNICNSSDYQNLQLTILFEIITCLKIGIYIPNLMYIS